MNPINEEAALAGTASYSGTDIACSNCILNSKTSLKLSRHTRRRLTAIYIAREVVGGWFVFAGDNAWLHGDRRSAVDDALSLSKNLGLPIYLRRSAS